MEQNPKAGHRYPEYPANRPGSAPKPAQQGPDPKADAAKVGSTDGPKYDGQKADD